VDVLTDDVSVSANAAVAVNNPVTTIATLIKAEATCFVAWDVFVIKRISEEAANILFASCFKNFPGAVDAIAFVNPPLVIEEELGAFGFGVVCCANDAFGCWNFDESNEFDVFVISFNRVYKDHNIGPPCVVVFCGLNLR